VTLSHRFWLGAIVVSSVCAILWLIFGWPTAPDHGPPLRPDVSHSDAVPKATAVTMSPPSLPRRIDRPSDAQARQAYSAAFSKPIAFVGKVVDEKNEAVADATVEWRATNNPDPAGLGTNGTGRSDEHGVFRVTSKGIALFVKVSKVGYYSINEGDGSVGASVGTFSNASVLGNTDNPMGTESAPAIFFLRKRGTGVSLRHLNAYPVKLPKDGTPVEFALDTGLTVSAGHGHLRIECWTEDQSKDKQGAYPWRCRISVPGGGLALRQNEFDFYAPTEGYAASDEMQSDKLKWSPIGERQYFIKTADGHFARVNLRIRTGGDHFAVVDSYFNPVRDSRNLEPLTGDHSR